MTPKERAAMQLALEALEELFHSNSTKVAVEKYNTAHNALRKALAEPQVDWQEEALRLGGLNAKHVGELRKLKAEQAEQEPVAEVHNTDTPSNWSIIKPGLPAGTKLYAAPVRTKDLTDEEMEELCRKYARFELIREAIAADREKNK